MSLKQIEKLCTELLETETDEPSGEAGVTRGTIGIYWRNPAHGRERKCFIPSCEYLRA